MQLTLTELIHLSIPNLRFLIQEKRLTTMLAY